jgi:hypothetical protein
LVGSPPDLSVGTFSPAPHKLGFSFKDMADEPLLPEEVLNDHTRWQELIFASSYLKHFNTAQASRDAGVTPETGRKMRERPRVKETLKTLIQRRCENALVDATFVLDRLNHLYHVALQEEDYGLARQLLNDIGKHTDVGAFKERHEVVHTVDRAGGLEAARKRAELRIIKDVPPPAPPQLEDRDEDAEFKDLFG